MSPKVKDRLRETLLFAQRYTKTDMLYLAHGGFWVMLSYGIQVGTGVVTTIALANLLPKESFGTYQFVLSVASVLSVMTLSGLGVAITRAVARGNDGVLRSGVRTKLKWSTGIVLTSGAVSLYYYLNGNSALATAFLFVGAFAPFIESFKLYQNYLQGKEQFKDGVLLGAWRKPLPLIALIVTALLTHDVVVLVLVYFLSNVISYASVYFAVIQKYQPPDTNDAETLSISKHQSALRIMGHIGQHADKILIWHFLGAAAVAHFTIAQLTARYSGGMLNTLSAIVLPKVSKRDLATLKQTLPRKVWLFTALMAIGTCIYILVIPFVFPLVFPEYLESILLSQVLAASFLFMPRKVYTQVLIAHKQTRAQYILAISMTSVKLILLYTLLSLYGIWGAVFAILGTELLSNFAVRYFFHTAKEQEL